MVKTKKDTKITAFHGIFDQRLKALVKQIKKIRSTKDYDKARVKQLLKDAKVLRAHIEVETTKELSIQIPYKIIDGVVTIDTAAIIADDLDVLFMHHTRIPCRDRSAEGNIIKQGEIIVDFALK